MSNHPIQLGLVEPGNQQDAVGCTVAFPGEHPSSLVGKPDTWSEHLLCPGDFEDTRELVGRAEKDHHQVSVSVLVSWDLAIPAVRYLRQKRGLKLKHLGFLDFEKRALTALDRWLSWITEVKTLYRLDSERHN
jgi:hypothetical protein